MHKKLIWAVAACALCAGPVRAQVPPPPQFPGPELLPPLTSSDPLLPIVPHSTPLPEMKYYVDSGPPARFDRTQFWVRGEFLSWWVKDAPRPITLATTGDPNSSDAADLRNNTRYDDFSGLRIGVGGWLDKNQNVGFETSYFFLGRRTNHEFVSSDNGGFPMLAFPFTSTDPAAPGQFILPISNPGQFAGNVLASSSLEMWGTEINGAFCLARTPTLEFTVLAGFRYLDLQENLSIRTVSSDLTTKPNTVMFLNDQFNTRNQFYGGQLGSRLTWQGERWAFDVTGKVALGSTHQVVDIQGSSSQFGPGGVNGTFPGGFFTQPSNIGRSAANQFTVVPSLELKLHYLLSPRWRVFMGYDFLYWNQVVRPGGQIDRNLNLTQSAIFGTGTLNGPATPTPSFSRSDFWTQGLSFGFEFRF